MRKYFLGGTQPPFFVAKNFSKKIKKNAKLGL